MKVEIYTVQQLEALLSDRNFWFQEVVPITKHRAQLVINNPRSAPRDPVLFVVKDAARIIGYRLVFPDRIYMEDETVKLGWGSSFWVNKEYRGKGIGRLLFQKSLELWDGNIGSLIQSRDAARVYENNPQFYCFKKSVGFQFMLRLNTRYWVQKKLQVPTILVWVLAVVDFPFNSILGALKGMWLVKKKPLNAFLLEYCREVVDPETFQFVETCAKNSLTRKGVEDLNAIVRYPTSMATPLPDRINTKYYFATKASRFDYFYLKVFDTKARLIGLLLINVEGNNLKLLYYYYRSEDVLDTIFDLFVLHAAQLNTEIITSFDEVFNAYFVKRSGFPTLIKRRMIRKSFLPVRFENHKPSDYKIYDGDGA